MRFFSHCRRAVTLLELLVVLFITMLLAAVAIRTLRPVLENSQIRESARIITTMLGTARATAQATGRYGGVMFVPLPGNNTASMDLYYAESPPPYAGDSLSSRMQIKSAVAVTPATNPPSAVLTVVFPQNDAWTTQVAVGDVLQLNRQGHLYTITAINTGGSNPQLTVSCSTNASWPQITNSSDPTDVGYSFQFFRQPQKSTAIPVQLPAGAAVDLMASGIGSSVFTPNGSLPVTVTFSPTGQLDQVYSPAYPQGQRPSDNVYLLIGRVDGTGTSANLENLKCIWVAIAYQSGLVITAENAATATASISVPADLTNARRLAATGTSMGG